MPIYEYECPGCGKAFDKRVSFSQSDERQECPHCGNRNAKRQISLIAAPAGSTKGSSDSFTSAASCGPVG
jgi:putative FmdB family regulatory protein